MLGWKIGESRFLSEIATKHSVGDLIRDEPARVSYRRSIELLLECDGALILGVDDIGYIPSKLFSYGLSGKPILSAIREEGAAFRQFAQKIEHQNSQVRAVTHRSAS